MLTIRDLEYHLQREEREKSRAAAASDPGARAAHLHLAAIHARRAELARLHLERRRAGALGERRLSSLGAHG